LRKLVIGAKKSWLWLYGGIAVIQVSYALQGCMDGFLCGLACAKVILSGLLMVQ
jgi:hypothetical protein